MAHGERPHTLTLAFAEYVGSANDESPLAEQLAAQFGTRHATVMVRKADFMEQREQLLAAMDQPSIDGVNTWFVSQAAASQGIKVALSGLGGDEPIASYPSVADLPPIRNLSRLRQSSSTPGCHRRSRPSVAPRLSSPRRRGSMSFCQIFKLFCHHPSVKWSQSAMNFEFTKAQPKARHSRTKAA